MRLVRFIHGDRIAHGVADGDAVRVLRGTFFQHPVPTGEELALDDVRLEARCERLTREAGVEAAVVPWPLCGAV